MSYLLECTECKAQRVSDDPCFNRQRCMSCNALAFGLIDYRWIHALKVNDIKARVARGERVSLSEVV